MKSEPKSWTCDACHSVNAVTCVLCPSCELGMRPLSHRVTFASRTPKAVENVSSDQSGDDSESDDNLMQVAHDEIVTAQRAYIDVLEKHQDILQGAGINMKSFEMQPSKFELASLLKKPGSKSWPTSPRHLRTMPILGDPVPLTRLSPVIRPAVSPYGAPAIDLKSQIKKDSKAPTFFNSGDEFMQHWLNEAKKPSNDFTGEEIPRGRRSFTKEQQARIKTLNNLSEKELDAVFDEIPVVYKGDEYPTRMSNDAVDSSTIPKPNSKDQFNLYGPPLPDAGHDCKNNRCKPPADITMANSICDAVEDMQARRLLLTTQEQKNLLTLESALTLLSLLNKTLINFFGQEDDEHKKLAARLARVFLSFTTQTSELYHDIAKIKSNQ